MSTGARLILIVSAIGFELARQSMLSIQKFGLSFWTGSVWDPVAGEFGALPFIWGTLYSSVLALLIATPVAIGIAVFQLPGANALEVDRLVRAEVARRLTAP